MTLTSPNTRATPRSRLSMFDVYSGYVVTQGHNALMYVVMWERAMRVIAIAALLAIAALWLMPDAANGPQVVPMKLILSGVLGAMAGLLLWSARVRPQYETQINLIHGELRQVMRAASGIERLMLRVPFEMVVGLYVKANRTSPEASCLFLEVDGVETHVLLGVGDETDLNTFHRRLSADLALARTQPQSPRRDRPGGAALSGIQAA